MASTFQNRESVEDDERPGCPQIASTTEKIEKVFAVVLAYGEILRPIVVLYAAVIEDELILMDSQCQTPPNSDSG
ncbi:hypothetical protein TNCV_607401 [Trichonephila clavipes]|nr:hypothetical protein TNCV_607401 [Trichonephila clavipes]